jgi:hypothetical protein
VDFKERAYMTDAAFHWMSARRVGTKSLRLALAYAVKREDARDARLPGRHAEPFQSRFSLRATRSCGRYSSYTAQLLVCHAQILTIFLDRPPRSLFGPIRMLSVRLASG